MGLKTFPENSMAAGDYSRPQSILGRAFRDELVPQDSRDEPASELLARIRTTCDANHPRSDQG